MSYDGAWQRRGLSSHNGVGVVIDLLSGLPIDFKVFSSFAQSVRPIVTVTKIGS